MPLKLNVGLSRKIGEANYGSRGASVNLELELDSSIVTEPERLQDRIRQLFVLAKSSIDEELQASNGATSLAAEQRSRSAANGYRSPASRVAETRTSPGSRSYPRSSGAPTATNSQVRTLRAIAHRADVNLDAIVCGLKLLFAIRSSRHHLPNARRCICSSSISNQVSTQYSVK